MQSIHRTSRHPTDLKHKPISKHYIVQQGTECTYNISLSARITSYSKASNQSKDYQKYLEHAITGNGQIHDFWHKTGILRRRQKHPELWRKYRDSRTKKQTFRIILANRNTHFYQLTQFLMATDSKVLPSCLSLRVPQHNSLSLTCAHDILLVTILTLPISISSLLSRVHLHLVAAKRGANLFFISYE